MKTAKINTDNEWTTVIDKKKVKKEKRMKKKLLKEQQNKKNNYRNKSNYNNSRKLYQKKTKIKSEIKTIQNTPETTDKKNNIAIMTNVFSSLLNEFDESSE